MQNKRVTIFCGHYGSGKTNLAVNYALKLKNKGVSVRIADLDIVNPYFRTKDSEKELKDAGIELISSDFAGSNVDLPALPSSVYKLVQSKDAYAVLDVGGDDRGAYALGRYTPYILEENDYEMLYVVNFYRPLTPDVISALEVMREIEAVSRIKFTAIVNNSNLAGSTDVNNIISSCEKAEELSRLSGIPLKMTSVRKDLETECIEKGINNVFPLELQKLIYNSDI